VSRITDEEWDPDCDWASCPAFDNAVYGELTLVNDIPTAARYVANPETDYRTGYHAAAYYMTKYTGPSATGPWTQYDRSAISESQYNTFYSVHGTTDIYYAGGIWYKFVISKTDAYYSTYIKYRTIDITAVMQDLIDHGGAGLIIWHDLAAANNTRKYFKSINNSSAYLQPRIDMTYEALPALTDPVIAAVGTVTDSPHEFSWTPSSDANGTVEASAISYEFKLSCDNGANWSEAQETDPGDPSASYDIKTCLSLEAGQYYYGALFKIKLRAKCTYEEVDYYSGYVESAAFAVDYRVTPTAPGLSVDNATPYEGETVVFTCTRPASYNTHDEEGNVNNLTYNVEISSTEVADETEAATSATKDVPYVVGALTSGADLSVNARARVNDTELQVGAYSSLLPMTIKRFRNPITNIAYAVRTETELEVHVDIQDTGFGGVQSNTQIRKIQYDIGAGYVDATLDGWTGLSNSFTITGLTGTTAYTLNVRAVNVEPVAGLGDKTGDPATEYIMQAQPVARAYSDSSTGKKGYAAQALYAHDTIFDPAEFPDNGNIKAQHDLEAGGEVKAGGVAYPAPANLSELIEEVILESDNTEILFQTGIVYDTTGRPLLLKLSIISNYAGANVISVYVNDDTVGTGYGCKYGINGAAPTSAANQNYVGYAGAADEMCVADVKITRNSTTDDVCFYGTGSERSNTANQSPSYFSGNKLNTGNITKVRIKSGQNMKAGSKAYLYRV
jgi:hypothetical protein